METRRNAQLRAAEAATVGASVGDAAGQQNGADAAHANRQPDSPAVNVTLTQENLSMLLSSMQQSQAEWCSLLLRELQGSRRESTPAMDASSFSTASASLAGANFALCQAKFSGAPSESVENFVDAVEIYKQATNITDENALRGLSLLLSNEAGTWWQGVKKTVGTWKEAIQCLKSAFGERRPPFQIYKDLFSMCQGQQTTDLFIAQARALLARIPDGELSEKTQIDMVFGLLDMRIRKRVDRDSVSSFDELLRRARSIEDALKESSGPPPPTRGPPPVPSSARPARGYPSGAQPVRVTQAQSAPRAVPSQQPGSGSAGARAPPPAGSAQQSPGDNGVNTASSCHQEFSSDGTKHGILTSPHYPSPYPPNTHCHYEFFGRGKERVRLIFQDFFLYKSADGSLDCNNVDSLQAFINVDGRLEKVDTLCGVDLPKPIMSNGPKLMLEFRGTHSSRYARGFKISYSFVENFGITTGRQLKEFPCAFVYNSTEARNGTFASPNAPGPYPRDTECTYFFHGGDNEKVHLHFTNFDVEGVLPCEAVSASDYVEFSNYMTEDNRYGRYCGQMKEFHVESERNFFKVTFRSNDRLDGTGFKAIYQFLDITDEYKSPMQDDASCGTYLFGHIALLIIATLTQLSTHLEYHQ